MPNKKSSLLVLVVLLITASLSAIGQDEGVLANVITPLDTPTYDHSGQATEPSVIYFPSGWNGYKYWMALAPYPHSDDSYENPSILVSEDGIAWSVPPGVTNPLEKPAKGSHLADPSLFYDRASNQLWLFYVAEDPSNYMNLLRIVSPNGTQWSRPQRLLHVPEYQMVMPAIASDGGQYWLWTLDAGTEGCSAASTRMLYRTSPDGVHWSNAQPVNIAQPGYRIWHISVATLPPYALGMQGSPDDQDPQFTGFEWPHPSRIETRWDGGAPHRPTHQPPVFVMLASSFSESCGRDKLFLAYSRDGVSWATSSKPLLTPDEKSWDSAGIYQSTLVYDARTHSLRIWYSADGRGGWRIGLAQGNFRSVLRELSPNPR